MPATRTKQVRALEFFSALAKTFECFDFFYHDISFLKKLILSTQAYELLGRVRERAFKSVFIDFFKNFAQMPDCHIPFA